MSTRHRVTTTAALGALIVCGFCPAGLGSTAQPDGDLAQPVGTNRMVSVADGDGADDDSYAGAPSDHGNVASFYSAATNLVEGDVNDRRDVFVRDSATHDTTLVSRAVDGGPANDHSSKPDVSSTGRYLAFDSDASNLVADDTNGRTDAFVYDRSQDEMILVSRRPDGEPANGQSNDPRLSADARFVAYYSYADDLVPGDTNVSSDVFVWDRMADTTTLVSRGRHGGPVNRDSSDPDISADGRYVTYTSEATNIVAGRRHHKRHIYVFDLVTETTRLVDHMEDGQPSRHNATYESAISDDGQSIAFGSRANLAPGGARKYVDVFVYDVPTGAIELITTAYDGGPVNDDGYLNIPSISGDGRFVAFESSATNLVEDPPPSRYNDIFVYDRTSGVMTLATLTPDGLGTDQGSFSPLISSDGRYVAYSSYASNLVPSDTNGHEDAFLYRVY